jgi:hypothetical protein
VRENLPNLLLKNPRTASSSATLMSHKRAISKPPPTAYPDIAAITGLLNSSRVGP